jgi:hypothetical protein
MDYDNEEFAEEFYEDNDEYEHDDQEQRYEDEMGAWDRVGGGISVQDDKRRYENPIDQFKVLIDAIARSLEGAGLLNAVSKIDNLLKPINDIKRIDHINPTAYILGYFASRGGTSITQQSMNDMFAIIPNLEVKIDKADVVRYARFWLSLNKL